MADPERPGATPFSADDARDLRRSRDRYRVALFALVVADLTAVALAIEGPRVPTQPALKRVEVSADLAAAARSQASDQEVVYFADGHGEVYLHVMAPGQTCPFHLHQTSEEVVLILAGDAQVAQSRVVDGGLTLDEGEAPPGTLVVSPLGCGHSFSNSDVHRMLANLVFTMPGYDGNFYVSPSNPRLLQGGAPSRSDLPSLRRQFLGTTTPAEDQALPGLGGHLHLLQTRTQVDRGSRRGAQVLYILGGVGTLVAGDRSPLKEGTLVVIPPGQAVSLLPASDPLSLVVFAPGDAAP